jgi:hypothetical protein
MGRAAQHFGHDAEKEGEKAADDLVSGKITKKEFREKYKDAKFRGDDAEFKKGYAKGAAKHTT